MQWWQKVVGTRNPFIPAAAVFVYTTMSTAYLILYNCIDLLRANSTPMKFAPLHLTVKHLVNTIAACNPFPGNDSVYTSNCVSVSLNFIVRLSCNMVHFAFYEKNNSGTFKGSSIGTDIGDFEWLCTAYQPLLCFISPNSLSLQPYYVTMVKTRPIFSAVYLLPLSAKTDPLCSAVSLR